MLAVLAVAACGPARTAAHPSQTPIAAMQPTESPTPTEESSPTSTPSPTPTQAKAPAPSLTHVFVIVMENRSSSEALSGHYTAQLARQYGSTTNYHGITHPSLPNYLAMTSGSTWGITDDGYHALPAGGLGAQLTAAGISWRAYMEGVTGGCLSNTYPYSVRHNPFAYYGGRCPAQVVPFTQFSRDIAGSVPRFVWITPGLCNDGHDCSTAVADAWLAKTVPTILATSAWKNGGVLFITWDEGEDSANSVLTIVIHPKPKFHTSGVNYNHYNLLATIEDRFRLRRLGAAARATAMSDLMATGT